MNCNFSLEALLYNILGQRIKSILLEEDRRAGKYNINYNADNLSSGVYFALLKQNQIVSKG